MKYETPMLRCASLLMFLLTGCGGVIRELAPMGGDAFTLFPPPSRPPPAITCVEGDDAARFACAAAEIESRVHGHDAHGALLLVTGDDAPRVVLVSSDEVPVTADTRFFIASISKMFVAAAAVSLSLEGQLDLDVPISTYLTELDAQVGVGSASLTQLLSHTSGLPNPVLCGPQSQDIFDAVGAFRDSALFAPPGAVFNYSNLGYTFVAAVIERVTGQRFEAVVAQRVFAPAGIPNATFDPSAVTLEGHSPTHVSMCRAMRPAGGLALTIHELGTWAHGLSAELPALGPEIVDILTQPHAETGGGWGAYGFGVQRIERHGVLLFAHSGGLPGFSSFVAWSPEHHLAVAAVADVAGGFPGEASLRMVSTILRLSPDWSPPRQAAHPLTAYVGLYRDDSGTLGRIRVGQEGLHLTYDYLDGTPPISPTEIHFAFTDAATAHYLVTAVGVAARVD